jgi:hypothetical protein
MAGTPTAKTVIPPGLVDVPVHVMGPLFRTVWLTFRKVKGGYDLSDPLFTIRTDTCHVDK